MSPLSAAALGAIGALVLLLAILLAVDQFVTPLPTIRKFRGYIGAALGMLLAVLTLGLLRKRKPDDGEPVAPPKPVEFDDAKAVENQKDALDTDVDPTPDAAVDAVIGDILSERSRAGHED